jgi:hypothetical protein
MALNQEEKLQLTILLEKAVSTDIRGSLWHALVKIFPTVPIELIVLNERNEVFLVYRDDFEFKGWHHPGSVWNAWETIPERREKLVSGELTKNFGVTVTKPQPIGWMGVYRGIEEDGPNSNPTRVECSLVHIAYLTSVFINQQGASFFSLDDLPDNTLAHHKYILRRVKQYLIDGILLCD